MAFTTRKLAIDIGNSMTRIYIRKHGIALTEPSVIAVDTRDNITVATGSEALSMVGRSPDSIQPIYPIQSGVIANYAATKELVSSFIQKVSGRVQLRKIEAMVTVSATASSTEKRALVDAMHSIGLQYVHLIQTPIAAALGAGLPVGEAKGSMVVDIGSGTTEVGVFSLGGIVAIEAIRVGGNNFNDEITRYMRRNHNLALGNDEIRSIIHNFIALDSRQEKMITAHGQHTIQGVPKTSRIKHSLLVSHIEQPINAIIEAIHKTLEQTPPDLLGDIINNGIVLTGGGAQLKGLDHYISKKLNVATVVGQDPALCSIKGAFYALTHAEDYKRALRE